MARGAEGAARGGPSATTAVYRHLRHAILAGDLTPGQVLKQDALGRQFGVSATPVREALLMLDKDGLVVAAPQQRARVVGFDPARVEALYAERISLEAVGAGVTAGQADQATVGRLQSSYRLMVASATEAGVGQEWHDAHREFHLATVTRLGDGLVAKVGGNIDRSRHYMQMHRPETTDHWSAPARWHEATLVAFEALDADAAAAAVAQDLASAAVALIRFMTPDYVPALIHDVCGRFGAVPLVDRSTPAFGGLPRVARS